MLYRYRRRVLCTDSALALTRGSPVGPLALLWQLDPGWETFTAVCPARRDSTVIGQVHYTPGERSAHMAFLSPDDEADNPGMLALVEGLVTQAGAWGAGNVLAEVDELSPMLELLRRIGFTVYGWQTIWQFPATAAADGEQGVWRLAEPMDELTQRNLYHSLVPPLVQAAEPYVPSAAPRLIYRQDGDMLAYVDAVYGPQGIYLQPVVHPAVKNVPELLGDLLAKQPVSPVRPIYVAARSYQAWLETSLERLEGNAEPRQALLVKHMALGQRSYAAFGRKVLREVYSPEATAPLVRNSSTSKN